MIALIITGAFLLIVLCVLFLPICVFIDFKDNFFTKIYFLGIKVYEIKPEAEKQNKTQKAIGKKEKKPSLFEKFKEKYGFSGAVKEFFGFFKAALFHTKKFLRHIKFDKVKIFIKIATDDAAKTAIEYGAVCGVAYPILAELSTLAKINYKKIDILSDFESKTSEFNFSLKIRLCIFYCLITAYKLYKEYKNFTARIETDE
ncbi:MAG: DUF2953 domain-containing protein [Clostridia bacterium]|nr:DUF2953 domain-containing protein [Clostridia bacterium]